MLTIRRRILYCVLVYAALTASGCCVGVASCCCSRDGCCYSFHWYQGVAHENADLLMKITVGFYNSTAFLFVPHTTFLKKNSKFYSV